MIGRCRWTSATETAQTGLPSRKPAFHRSDRRPEQNRGPSAPARSADSSESQPASGKSCCRRSSRKRLAARSASVTGEPSAFSVDRRRSLFARTEISAARMSPAAPVASAAQRQANDRATDGSTSNSCLSGAHPPPPLVARPRLGRLGRSARSCRSGPGLECARAPRAKRSHAPSNQCCNVRNLYLKRSKIQADRRATAELPMTQDKKRR